MSREIGVVCWAGAGYSRIARRRGVASSGSATIGAGLSRSKRQRRDEIGREEGWR